MSINDILNQAPVFVHTGPEHLSEVVSLLLDNNIGWIAGGNANAKAETYARRFGEKVGVSIVRNYSHARGPIFLFDYMRDDIADQAMDCCDIEVDTVIEHEDLFVQKIDLSDVDALIF